MSRWIMAALIAACALGTNASADEKTATTPPVANKATVASQSSTLLDDLTDDPEVEINTPDGTVKVRLFRRGGGGGGCGLFQRGGGGGGRFGGGSGGTSCGSGGGGGGGFGGGSACGQGGGQFAQGGYPQQGGYQQGSVCVPCQQQAQPQQKLVPNPTIPPASGTPGQKDQPKDQPKSAPSTPNSLVMQSKCEMRGGVLTCTPATNRYTAVTTTTGQTIYLGSDGRYYALQY